MFNTATPSIALRLCLAKAELPEKGGYNNQEVEFQPSEIFLSVSLNFNKSF